MSEWLKEHAWKSDSLTHNDAQQHPPTQFPSTTSRNNDVLHDAPVSDDVHRGFRGVCDAVLTQKLNPLPTLLTGTATYASESTWLDIFAQSRRWSVVESEAFLPHVRPAEPTGCRCTDRDE